MLRQYRIWDKKNNVMIYPESIRELSKYEYQCNDYVIMECIGIEDKNGEDVYVGDIVKGLYYRVDEYKLMKKNIEVKEEGEYEIKKGKDNLYYELKPLWAKEDKKQTFITLGIYPPDHKLEIEVVGNKYSSLQIEIIQKQNRVMIKEAIYSCNYSEVEEIERKSKWSYITKSDFISTVNRMRHEIGCNEEWMDDGIFYPTVVDLGELISNGIPLTIDRVLLAFDNIGKIKSEIKSKEIIISHESTEEIKWDLTKINIEDQSETTQRLINKLLTNLTKK